jgi:hypothetical protein
MFFKRVNGKSQMNKEQVQNLIEDVVVFSHQGSVVDQFLEVVKERCLKMLHDKFSFVWVVSIVLNTTYMITETEEIARKQ